MTVPKGKPKAGKAKVAKTAPKPLTAAQKLNAIGIEAIVERISGGESQPKVAKALGVTLGGLSCWLAADSDRSARVREAMEISARLWDDKAVTVLEDANEDKPGAIAKARELASHYRWRAKCYAPKDYGDKIQNEHTGANGEPINMTINFVGGSGPRPA